MSDTVKFAIPARCGFCLFPLPSTASSIPLDQLVTEKTTLTLRNDALWFSTTDVDASIERGCTSCRTIKSFVESSNDEKFDLEGATWVRSGIVESAPFSVTVRFSKRSEGRLGEEDFVRDFDFFFTTGDDDSVDDGLTKGKSSTSNFDIISTRPIRGSTGSDHVIAQARNWLESCKNQHTKNAALHKSSHQHAFSRSLPTPPNTFK